MEKRIRFVSILAIAILLVSSTQLSAQKTVVGLGATYGTNSKGFGAFARAGVKVSSNFRLIAEGIYYPERTLDEGTLPLQVTGMKLNINVQYLIGGSTLRFYPFAGFNYSRESEENSANDVTETATGLNLGIGIEKQINKLMPFAEYSFQTGFLREHNFAVGLGYLF